MMQTMQNVINFLLTRLLKFVKNKNEQNRLLLAVNNTHIFTRWNLSAKPTKKCVKRRPYLHVDLSAVFARRNECMALLIPTTSQIRLDTCILPHVFASNALWNIKYVCGATIKQTNYICLFMVAAKRESPYLLLFLEPLF